MAHIILYEHADFQGRQRDVFHNEPFLADFDNITSSFRVIEGHWQFFTNANYQGPMGPTPHFTLGPSVECRWVRDWGIDNDAISSVQLISG